MTNYRDVAAWTGSRTRAKEGNIRTAKLNSGKFQTKFSTQLR